MQILDEVLVKKPHKSQKWSQEQIDELGLAMEDPIHFIQNYAYIQHPVKGKVSFDLFEY